MYDIKIVPHDAVHVKLEADRDVLKTASDQFKFRIKNAHFHPKVKLKMWDGYIKLVNVNNGLVYHGLLNQLVKFAEDYNYSIKINDILINKDKIDLKLLEQWANKELNLPNNKSPRDYQLAALKHIIDNRRGLIISPTGSGKSLIAYLISKWFDKKILIIVPSLNLISQMEKDFIDYGCSKEHIHLIYAGQEKISNCPITISTWQSLFKLPEEYFNQYEAVIADEVHGFTAKEMVSMMERMKTVFFRIGMTGSLDDSETDEMVLTGLFGEKFITKTTKELIDEGVLTKPIIYVIKTSYDKKSGKPRSDASFDTEINFLCSNEQRNSYITKIVDNLKGNTLVLFNYVDKHGKILYANGIEKLNRSKDKIHLIYGKVDKEDREKIRQIVINSDDNVIYASYKTLSTGVNIPNLHNIIFASPSRSTIRIVQSIGRGLRRHDSKDIVKIIDFADVLKHSKSQMIDRIAIYENQEYEYKFIEVSL